MSETEDRRPGTDAASYDTTDAEVAEQHTDLEDEGDEPQGQPPDDVNEADYAEQGRVVEQNEDEYR